MKKSILLPLAVLLAVYFLWDGAVLLSQSDIFPRPGQVFFGIVELIQRGLLLPDPYFERLRRVMPLERGLALGAVLLLLGLTTFGIALARWYDAGFGELGRGGVIRFVIVSSTTLVLGAQILYGSFFLYLLDHRSRRCDGATRSPR